MMFALLAAALLGTEAADTPVEPPINTTKLPSFEHVSCTGSENEIRVVVKNVRESVGLIVADLYRDDPENFLSKEGREIKVSYAAVAPVTRFCIPAPIPAGYAIAVYHDQNANLRFDRGPLGMPAEPYGVSNNPRMRLGPPALEEALFHVHPQGAAVEIVLRK
jgi:uncharacterized protein (DUF2141 family)